MAKAKKKDFKVVREKLLAEREELTRQMAELERQRVQVAEAVQGGALGEDSADTGTATFERERDLSLAENIRDLLEKVDRALRLVDEGTYGSCESCGKRIEAARLKALPYATLCIDCKRREETRR